MTSVQSNGGAELLATLAATNPALHTHLTSLITHLIQHQPADPFQHIEQLSAQLASQQAKPTAAAFDAPPASLAAYLNESPYLFNKRPPPAAPANADGEEEAAPVEEEEDAPIPALLPNLASLASLLHEAGVALPSEEALLLDKALVALLKGRDNVESARYWGRLHTLSAADYHVFELKRSGYDEDEERDRATRERAVAEAGQDVAEGRELYGSGANEYVYFVTQSIHAPSPAFTQLPAALPRHIADSRRGRRLLTGSLSAAVGGFPPFAGTEADLVRSIVARVSSGSVVVPRGSWREEEGEVVIEDEAWRGVVRGERVGWVHVRGKLRRDGRVEAAEEEAAADGEEEESEEKKAQRAANAEAKAPLLSAASAEHFSYRASTALDTAQLPPPPPAADSDEPQPPVATSHVTHSAHSLAWPGSVSVVRGKEYGSVYIGWGLRQAVGGEVRWMAGEVGAMEREWVGELVEQAEVLATEEEAAREREEEEEKKKEEGDKKEEEEVDELPDDEEDKPEDE